MKKEQEQLGRGTISRRGQLLWAVLCLCGLGLVRAGDAASATYYVDPQTGNDANAGTAQSAPWKTIPGTRTTSDSGWLRSTWGSISTTNKVKAGDVIELKAGSTMNSTMGGKLIIDSTYYNSGTATAPIVIQVSKIWGTGPFTYDMSGMTNPTWRGMIEIRFLNYINMSGADSTRRFVAANAPGPGDFAMLVTGTSASSRVVGHRLSYLEIRNAARVGFDIKYANSWTVENSISHDNGLLGFGVGGLDDAVTQDGLFVDSEAYRIGLNQTGDATSQGFGLYGGINITYLRCRSHDNRRDGFDFGTASNTNSASATVIDSASYNNREDGFGANGGTSGTTSFNYINVIAFNNGQAGWTIYDGPIVGIYHSIAHSNGTSSSFGGNLLAFTDSGFPAPSITLRNNVFYKPKLFAQIGNYNPSGPLPTINSDYNIYIPRSSNSETFSDFPNGTYRTYSNPPSFVGAHDKLGIAFDPGFISATNTTDSSVNNYHLAATSSSAIKAGLALTNIAAAAMDRDGVARSTPPDVGLYQFSTQPVGTFPAPTNLRAILVGQ